jgi:hypothetical protein
VAVLLGGTATRVSPPKHQKRAFFDKHIKTPPPTATHISNHYEIRRFWQFWRVAMGGGPKKYRHPEGVGGGGWRYKYIFTATQKQK